MKAYSCFSDNLYNVPVLKLWWVCRNYRQDLLFWTAIAALLSLSEAAFILSRSFSDLLWAFSFKKLDLPDERRYFSDQLSFISSSKTRFQSVNQFFRLSKQSCKMKWKFHWKEIFLIFTNYFHGCCQSFQSAGLLNPLSAEYKLLKINKRDKERFCRDATVNFNWEPKDFLWCECSPALQHKLL